MTACKETSYCGMRKDILLQRLSSLEVPIARERKSWKEKPLSATERLQSDLTGTQTFHCQFSSSQAHFNHSRNSWQPSCNPVSVLHSLVSCILSQSLSFLGCHYSFVLRNLCNATCLARCVKRAWNRPFTRTFSLCGEKWFGNETIFLLRYVSNVSSPYSQCAASYSSTIM